jgi:hypothetical protein
MFRYPRHASSDFIRRLTAAATVALLATLSACAPKPAAPTPAPTPTAAQPTVSQTCPGPTDGPSIIVQAVEDSQRAMAENPTGPVPPVCLVTAFARLQTAVPDSLNAHALAIATELDRRGADRRELLGSEIMLLSRARRYQDVSRAYDRLVAIDPQPPMDVVRAAIVAAHERGDASTLLKLLTAASTRSDAPPALRTEQNVVRQTAALHAAINESRGLVRQNPKYVAAYPSLVGNFGTLGEADSVVAYIGRALRQGTTRAALAPALDPFVNTMLRHAALYGSAWSWDTEIAAATRVDSALSTPSTKFLVATLIVQAIEPQVAELGSAVSGSSLMPRTTGGSAAGGASQPRADACRRIPPLLASLDSASARMREGGDRYAGGGVSQIASGIAAERQRLSDLRDVCTRAP